jgi:hypothetical protein
VVLNGCDSAALGQMWACAWNTACRLSCAGRRHDSPRCSTVPVGSCAASNNYSLLVSIYLKVLFCMFDAGWVASEYCCPRLEPVVRPKTPNSASL